MIRTMRVLAVAAVTSFGAAVVVPEAVVAAGRAHHVTINYNGPVNAGIISGHWSGAGLGSGPIHGTLKIPVAIITFVAKGGSFTTKSSSCNGKAKLTPPTYTGCWKAIKGTGKFRGVSGGGTLNGNLDGHGTYRGTLRF